jgi:hypothetical protein
MIQKTDPANVDSVSIVVYCLKKIMKEYEEQRVAFRLSPPARILVSNTGMQRPRRRAVY